MPAPRFPSLTVDRPDLDAAEARVQELLARLQGAQDAQPALAAVDDFEALRRRLDTWSGLAQIRFRQDTTDAARAEERRRADGADPRLQDLRQRFCVALLEHPLRRELEEHLGPQAFALWQRERDAFDPRVAPLIVREREAQARYTALVGGAKVEFRGASWTLPALQSFLADGDPDTRAAADRARWSWFAAHREALDEIFDELVKVRTELARELGHEDFRAVGYARMRRVDFDADDVARFRDAVREHVVPLGLRLAEEQREALGLERLRACDERVHRPGGAPRPGGDGAWMMDRAGEMFDALQARHAGELGTLFHELRALGLLDLESRDGKGAGGFCSFLRTDALGDRGRPFVFANFNGTTDDVRVFTHELGHAYQGYLSRGQRLTDYGRCTSESAEIHSMSLEYLTWPEMGRFFEGDADAFRRQHLAEALLFLPYGCAVDHFQHEVYAHPEMSPAERNATWARLEKQYVPWRDHDGAPHASEGGAWQRQLHLFVYPFYYVDYVLAGTVALQFWALARRDEEAAWSRYHELCARGGSLPFRGLVQSTNLGDPFAPGTLAGIVDEAARWLDGRE